AAAKACMEPDGRLVVSSATSDIGTGTYTVMTQIAAAAMGLPMEQVEFRLGDSNLSQAPLEGGSFTVSSVGTAVQQACEGLQAKLLDAAQQAPVSP
ncbi:MAG TPA: aldehyde oxidase, partial [Pseudomonas sp.]|nr:aldehyde oxidase [Pseudomonas sp.]